MARTVPRFSSEHVREDGTPAKEVIPIGGAELLEAAATIERRSPVQVVQEAAQAVVSAVREVFTSEPDQQYETGVWQDDDRARLEGLRDRAYGSAWSAELTL